MDAATLKQILIEEPADYTGGTLNDFAHLTANEAEQIYTIVDIATMRDKRLVGSVLMARRLDDRVFIELDWHDKLLVDAMRFHKPRTCPLSNSVRQLRDVNALPLFSYQTFP